MSHRSLILTIEKDSRINNKMKRSVLAGLPYMTVTRNCGRR